MSSDLYVGIDLGTTRTKAVLWSRQFSSFNVIKFNEKEYLPSVIDTTNPSNIIVGVDSSKEGMIYDIKRIIGKNSKSEGIELEKERFGERLIFNKEGNPQIKLNSSSSETLQPEEISAIILNKVKKTIIEQTQTDKFKVIVTVPATFTDQQKDATLCAAQLGGLDVIQILPEPTAAAYAYGVDQNNGNFFAFDFGGGTLDTTILKKTGNSLKVISAGGDQHLGGIDIDKNLFELVLNKIKNEDINLYNNLNITQSDDSKTKTRKINKRNKLRKEIEKAKIELSSSNDVIINLSKVQDCEEEEGIEFEITQKEFELINKNLFDKCKKVIDETLKKARMSVKEINKVFLVGGSSHIPAIESLIEEKFGKKIAESKLDRNIVVAKGACMYCYSKGTKVDGSIIPNLSDITLYPIYIKSLDDQDQEFMAQVVKENSTIPLTRSFEAEAVGGNAIVEIYEGTHQLGKFVIDNVQQPIITMELSIENDYLLHVIARLNNQTIKKAYNATRKQHTNSEIEIRKAHLQKYFK
ncbi:heat shock protein 70, putative [Entamoeba histolytica HM-1:IMSS-B]|uniref:Heat shock protein 70, putative n=4 Tax=Entamoeba histolytica TaxID=5759 RepID=C4M668_ENTH1|nr:heat shock protein 70, putative [Entamoeba histolytica HM-1:IMSS]EAL47238.1 heat shock protein 70, putative [Entamoeba histolytica HM-1:IMSS]EMH73803.1 heat shock protein 70, putative [Entamoeba histolytica HM-1:IMSS-B]GAT96953.1 heat shock protein 70 putative [Entamoeba histolytica]|eukprot:XP_652624.1 heat shock protein 70, putative [Entamoeba histolytica HM-1:IMSS]